MPKGNDSIIAALNDLLYGELAAIHQYTVHAIMNYRDHHGYKDMRKHAMHRAMDEMEHAEELIERIVILGGTPTVDKMDPITIGDTIQKQFINDIAAEERAVEKTKKAMKLCDDLSDFKTMDILEEILEDEEHHLDRLEVYMKQIDEIGLDNFLSSYIDD